MIRLPDPAKTNRISRFQVELRWSDYGLELKSVTDQPVVVDGQILARNDSAWIVIGSQVTLSDVATLHFLGVLEDESALNDSGATFFVPSTT